MNNLVALKRSWFALLKQYVFLVAMAVTTNALAFQPPGHPASATPPPAGAHTMPPPGAAGQSKDPKYLPLSQQIQWNMSREEISAQVDKMIKTLNRRKPVTQAKLKVIIRALGEVRNAVMRDDALSYRKAMQTFAGKSRVLSDSDRKRIEDAIGESDPAYLASCKANCWLGSCMASCGGSNGGAACGCYLGFPICGCGGGSASGGDLPGV